MRQKKVTSVFILTNLRRLVKRQKQGHKALAGGGLFHCDTQQIQGPVSQPFSPSLSTTDSAHSLLRLFHLLEDAVCSCQPVPDLCPLSGPRPFLVRLSAPRSPLLQSLLSAYSAHLLPPPLIASSSISGF